MLSQGCSMQAPHNHEMVRVVPWVPDSHAVEDPTVVSQDVFRPGPHYPPLTHCSPRPPILAPCAPYRKEVSRKILQSFRRQRCRNIPVPSPFTLLTKVHIQVTCKNQLYPLRPLCYCRLHVSYRRPVSRRQVTSDNVPVPLPRRQLTRNDICAELAYRLD